MYRKRGNQKIPILIFRISGKMKVFSKNSLDFRLKDLHLLNKTTAPFKGNNSKSGEELPHLFHIPQPDKKKGYIRLRKNRKRIQPSCIEKRLLSFISVPE